MLEKIFVQYQTERKTKFASWLLTKYGNLLIRTPLTRMFPKMSAATVREYYMIQADRGTTEDMTAEGMKYAEDNLAATQVRDEESKRVARGVFLTGTVFCTFMVLLSLVARHVPVPKDEPAAQVQSQ
ncbi:hypothetical protein [Pseudoxanthomonas winnipegensis]|uniref:Transmembrane protein n=1 Tax=Pseudoxanthomonas winnipegensis TaxID=2480810 RepID=A0A4Q8M2G1_9GAMM|nr:hypothetical protein [Pseudoxanthomonas winnipegensis]TAA41528.1 hypothetical protein EA655_11340 [Pseudoxanthomonas winnipegensis]